MRKRTNRTKAETERFYRKLLDEWARSGLSLRAFGAKRGIPEGSLSSWRHTLKVRDAERAKAKRSLAAQFVPVNVVGAAPEAGQGRGGYEIVLGGDRVLRLPADFDGARVAALVKAMASC
jgi:hypothetical protein